MHPVISERYAFEYYAAHSRKIRLNHYGNNFGTPIKFFIETMLIKSRDRLHQKEFECRGSSLRSALLACST